MHSNVTDSDRLSLFQNMQKIAKFPRTFRDGRYGGGGGGRGMEGVTGSWGGGVPETNSLTAPAVLLLLE